jgi:hypothetical protein
MQNNHRGFVADNMRKNMVGLVFPLATHGGRKTREKGKISKIKLLQSKNKLRAFVEEEERNSMVVAGILKEAGRKSCGIRKLVVVVVTKKKENEEEERVYSDRGRRKYGVAFVF